MSNPTPPSAAPAPAPMPAPTAAPAPEQEPGPVPYERFREVNQRLQDAARRLSEIETSQRETQEVALREQNRWRELYEQREQELKTEKRQRQRLEVAGRKGLPSDLVARLQGETPEELERDADALLSLFRPATPPTHGVPPSSGSPPAAPLDVSQMTPAEIRAARAAGKIRF